MEIIFQYIIFCLSENFIQRKKCQVSLHQSNVIVLNNKHIIKKSFEFTLLVIFFFYQIFFPMSGMSRMISVGFAVLYCMYIIYDTGLIMERLTPEEYIIAPAILYMDMVALFLRLLKLRGERERRNDQIKDWFPTRSDYYTNEIYFE